MPWVRIDENAMDHPKVVSLSDGAFRLWVTGLAHCQRFLTDGVITAQAMRSLRAHTAKRRDEILASGLWDRVEDGVQVHDYLEWNDSRQTVMDNRDWGKRRRELYADPALLATIRSRDKDRCRYCGKPVNWSDRRGPMGGTYDHVIARGPNTAENVVVACRGCNASKGDKPVDRCGMRLLPVPELVQNLNQSRPHISGVGGVIGTPGSLEGGLGETDPVQRFVSRHAELYRQFCGVGYIGNPQKDYQAACQIVAAFPDPSMQDAILAYGLNDSDPFMAKDTRTIPKIACRASKYAEELKAKKLA
jgi:5-methylcytosine-specific restriction endonuclease McrA